MLGTTDHEASQAIQFEITVVIAIVVPVAIYRYIARTETPGLPADRYWMPRTGRAAQMGTELMIETGMD